MSDLIGQTWGHYRLESVLGGSDLGRVYYGIHTSLNQPAAVRVIEDKDSLPLFRTRFLQESGVIAGLHHPNVIETYEFGEQEGLFFLAQELINAGSLDAFPPFTPSGSRVRYGFINTDSLASLPQGQQDPFLSLPLVIELICQAAEGLDRAHARQILHYDIKPSNILLHQAVANGSYTVKVSNFGLAFLLKTGKEFVETASAETLMCVSPELCAKSQRIDGRSDLYALGVVLYALVTGGWPFQITDANSAIYQHMRVPAPSPRAKRPDVPPLLEEIIARCLAKRPEERFASGKALSGALRQALNGQDRAIPPQTGPRVFSAPDTGGPVVAPDTLPDYETPPLVRVLDQEGRTLQVIEVRPGVITVGRQESNDIILPSSSIARQHLRINWNGERVQVTDLGSEHGTTLNETPLHPQIASTWGEGQLIQLDAFRLRLEGTGDPRTYPDPETAKPTHLLQNPTGGPWTPLPISAPANTRTASFTYTSIGLSVTPSILSITPGQPVTLPVHLTNMGTSVGWFSLTVEGVPAEWVQGAGRDVHLYPGMQETIDLRIQVDRRPGNQARSYPVVIQAHSREQGSQAGKADVMWIVEPFREAVLHLEPARASGRGSATYALLVQNKSNGAVHYIVSGSDNQQRLQYQFTNNALDLREDQEVRVVLMVRTARRLMGRAQKIPFQLHTATPGSLSAQSIPGEFINKALLPAWLLSLVGLLMLAAILAAGNAFGLVPLPGRGSAHPPLANATGTATATRPGPTPTASSSASTTPTQVALTSEQQAEQVIKTYYTAINNKDYTTAYNLWFNYPDTYQNFANGFANTKQDIYTITSVLQQADGTVKIDMQLLSTSTTDQQSSYQGYYLVGLQPDGSWKIVEASFQQTD